MEKRLTADLNVVANSNLEIQLLDGDLNIIQKLDDEPNDVGGLTSAELKAKFDESGNIIKKYINETLIPAVLTDDATEESRKQAEAARVAAEQGRVTAEASRVTAEQGRTSAESIRVQDEQKRVSAENSRVEAEAQRAAAEQARADETAGIVARATAQANAAAGSASQAAGSEQSAKDAAGTAINAATSASQSAAAASGSASQAQASAAAAAQSAASVDGINKTAQSWAVGGTGTRPGEDTDNAKYWAEQAQAVVGGDFATKAEAQGYVTTHNQSDAAHPDIREALNGKAAGTHASQHGKDGTDPIAPIAIGAVGYDAAQNLTDNQKTQARNNIGAVKSTFLGNISRNKIYKIGYFFKGSGESSSGAATIRIRNFTDYGNENYMLAFLGSYGFSTEYHGQITTAYISKISVYSDPSVTDRTKKYTVFVTTQDYVDWASVYIDNEHTFTRDFADVTDTFSALVDGLDKVWESEYEYLNPPMQLGVEYRTTERYLGKPVYVQVANFGTLPNSTEKVVYVAELENSTTKTFRWSGLISNGYVLPGGNLYTGWDNYLVGISGSRITVKTTTDESPYTATFTLWYTKSTD